MEQVELAGVTLTPLKIISVEKGDVLHALKSTDLEYSGFGEAYFSTVKKGAIKGWKNHQKMTMNLVVPVGSVEFVLYDGREDSPTYQTYCSVFLSIENYNRLTVPPGVWMAFRGIGDDLNLLLNIASIPHDPDEAITVELDKIAYDWN